MDPDTDSVTVYFVRHGETVGNVKVWVLPPDEDVLSETGKKQAKLLGQYLKSQGEKFDRAYCSPYSRTVETCEILLTETDSAVDKKQDERIREMYLGKYENGDARAVFKDLFSCGLEDLLDWTPEGGETRAQKGQRINSFLSDLTTTIDQESKSGEKILVVSHGGILCQMWPEIRALDDNVYKLINWKTEYKLVMKNTGYFKVKIERNPKPGDPRRIEILVGLGAAHLEQLENDPIYKFSKSSKGKVLDGCIQQ